MKKEIFYQFYQFTEVIFITCKPAIKSFCRLVITTSLRHGDKLSQLMVGLISKFFEEVCNRQHTLTQVAIFQFNSQFVLAYHFNMAFGLNE